MIKNPRFVAYCRVSTKKQGISGLGLESQQASCRQFAKARGGEIIAPEFVEVETGKNNTRPELGKAINRCRKTGSTLLVAKLDRLSRNAGFLMTLRDGGVELAAADMPDANTLVFTVMAGVAQHEAEAISSRTKAALAAAKARGTKLGPKHWNAPDIRKWQGKGVLANSVKAQTSAELLREDIQPLVTEGRSLRAIASYLNDNRIQTPFRRQWSAQGVKNVVTRLGITR